MDVRTTKSRDEVREILSYLHAIGGGVTDRYGFRDAFYAAVAHSLFDSAYVAYVQKSLGGVDELGASWAPLKAETIAYSKKNWRETLALPYASPIRPTLTQHQNKIWKTIFVHNKYKALRTEIEVGLAAYHARKRAIKVLNSKSGYKQSQSERQASESAAKLAWNILTKKFGAKTLMDFAESAVVPILKESGDMLASIRPNEFRIPYQPSPNQYAIVAPGDLRIGSSLPYTYVFKRRPFWPPGYKLWIDRAVVAGKNAIRDQLVKVLTNG